LVYDSTVQFKPMAFVRKVRSNASRDIVDSPFDFSAAAQLLLRGEQGEREVCDTVMDQTILPGVGNVIKCEGLLSSGIHPQTPMKCLTEATCRRLIKNLRDFALHWYSCCKSGKKPNKRVYGLTCCRVCGHEITLIRSGDIQRISYYCARCQCSGDAANKGVRNSIVGFFGDSKSRLAATQEGSALELALERWSCLQCTADNTTADRKCAACGAPQVRAAGSGVDGSSSGASVASLTWACSACTFSNNNTAGGCSMCGTERGAMKQEEQQEGQQEGQQEVVATAVQEGWGDSWQDQEKLATEQLKHTAREHTPSLTKEQTERVEANRQQALHRRTRNQKQQQQRQQQQRQQPETKQSLQPLDPRTSASAPPSAAVGCPLDPPSCKCRARSAKRRGGAALNDALLATGVECARASLQRVRKGGPNQQRLFWSCASPRAARCKFFMWADEQFPLCGHGRPSTMRRVLKPGENNGRFFFCCASSAKGEQCKLFQWAEGGATPGRGGGGSASGHPKPVACLLSKKGGGWSCPSEYGGPSASLQPRDRTLVAYPAGV
jgi:endonuclease VIII-like 3